MNNLYYHETKLVVCNTCTDTITMLRVTSPYNYNTPHLTKYRHVVTDAMLPKFVIPFSYLTPYVYAVNR